MNSKTEIIYFQMLLLQVKIPAEKHKTIFQETGGLFNIFIKKN